MRLAIWWALLAAAAPASTTPTTVTVTPAETEAATRITTDVMRGHIRFLSHDLLEGRGPGTRGDQLAELYIASQMEALGLQPGAPDGSWLQKFDILSVKSHPPKTTTFRAADKSLDLAYSDDYIAFSGVETAEAAVKDAEIVFVGYGIVAPEYGWNDYKGADLKGKVLLMMNNDPSTDPKLFQGNTRLYYGRWDYKYEIAGAQGAVAAIIIHTQPSAGYPWQVVQTSWSGERSVLPGEEAHPIQVKAWTTEDAAKRLAALGGKDLDALRAAAEKKDFKPVPLGVRWSIALQNDVAKRQTANVIGKLEGSDPVLKQEAVVYTAHHDHLGIREAKTPGEDVIYNGAVDNASGVAGTLAIARAMASLPKAPRRTVYFAAVGAEEQGLLGAKYLAAHPPIPAGRLAADINIDSMNRIGPTSDFTMVGMGKSTLDDVVQGLGKVMGRTVVPDQFPDRGFFYRSDQFALAKIGVPAAYLDPGSKVIGKPESWGKEAYEKWEATNYHQPSDELTPDFELAGAVEDARFLLHLGLQVANADQAPTWRPGDEFEAARKKALEELRGK